MTGSIELESQRVKLQSTIAGIINGPVFMFRDRLICPLPDENPFIIVIEMDDHLRTDYRHCLKNIDVAINYSIEKDPKKERKKYVGQALRILKSLHTLSEELDKKYPENGPWQGGKS